MSIQNPDSSWGEPVDLQGVPGADLQIDDDGVHDDKVWSSEKVESEMAKLSAQTTILNNAINPFVIFGASWGKTSSPVLTRTDAAVGLVANAGIGDEVVNNDFDRVQIFGEMHDVIDTLGNHFVRIPKFYIGKTDTPTSKTWRVSKTKYAGFYLPWCFWDFDKGEELPYIDVGKHTASLGAGDKLQSKPGLPPLVNTNIVNFRTYARNNNTGGLDGYQQIDIHVIDMLQTLFFIEFATLYSQSIMPGLTGARYTDTDLVTVTEAGANRVIVANATAALYAVGQTISLGPTQASVAKFYGRTITDISDYDGNNKAIYFDGEPVDVAENDRLKNSGFISGFGSKIAASSGQYIANSALFPMKYRGIESLYGDIYQWIDGLNISDYQSWIAKDAADYQSDKFESPYEKIGYVNHNADGWVKEMGYDPDYPFVELPVVVGGGAGQTAYYTDYYYRNTGSRVARFGGRWCIGSNAGLSCWHLADTSSTVSVTIGGRLLKKPL